MQHNLYNITPRKYQNSNVGRGNRPYSVPVVLNAAPMSARLQLVVYAK